MKELVFEYNKAKQISGFITQNDSEFTAMIFCQDGNLIYTDCTYNNLDDAIELFFSQWDELNKLTDKERKAL